MSDFEFGLLYSFRNPPRWHAPWAQVYDQHIQHIVEMEQAGFDTIWLTEHHFSEDGYLPQMATMTAALAMVTKKGSSGNRVGDFWSFYSRGSMQVSTLSRRYSSSRRPYARRWMTRILLLSPSTKPRETLFSGWQ